MTSGSVRGLVAVLLLLLSGCATPPPRGSVVKAETLAAAAPAVAVAPAQSVAAAQALAAPAAAPALIQPVTENQTFATRDGVPQYKIGVGDVLEILLTSGFAQEKQTVAVKPSGTVVVAFTEAKVAGRTGHEAEEEIRRLLAPFYRQISVEVIVKEYNSKKVAVLGAVAGKVGTHPLKGRTTIVDLLVEVGGPGPAADLERVRVVREDAPPLVLNLFRFLEEPRAQAFVLDAGDLVFIPTRGAAEAKAEERLEERKVFILGEVKSPGAYLLTPNMRLSQAIALAGGTTDLAILESARIIRGGLGKPLIVEADFRRVLEEGDPTQDVALQPADLIVLPRSAIGNWNAFIAKIKPTLEVLTFPLALPVQINAISR